MSPLRYQVDAVRVKNWLLYSNCVMWCGFLATFKLFKLHQFQYFTWILINLMNDDAFVSAVMVDMHSIVLVCLFMIAHVLAWLQDKCLDLVCCAFFCKLSTCMRNITAFCQHLLRLIKSVILANTNLSVKPKYWPIYRSIFDNVLCIIHSINWYFILVCAVFCTW